MYISSKLHSGQFYKLPIHFFLLHRKDEILHERPILIFKMKYPFGPPISKTEFPFYKMIYTYPHLKTTIVILKKVALIFNHSPPYKSISHIFQVERLFIRVAKMSSASHISSALRHERDGVVQNTIAKP